MGRQGGPGASDPALQGPGSGPLCSVIITWGGLVLPLAQGGSCWRGQNRGWGGGPALVPPQPHQRSEWQGLDFRPPGKRTAHPYAQDLACSGALQEHSSDGR